MDILISNATVVTMNEKMEILFGGFIGITGKKISYIGKTPPKEQPKTIIDGTGMVAIPGLVNCHTHLATTVLRNYLDDNASNEALEELLTRAAKMDDRAAKASALLGIAECLRFGITSVSDLYDFPEATAQAVAESGIKANIALAANRFQDENEEFDFETDEQCQRIVDLAKKWNGYDDGRILIDAGIYAAYTSNYQLWEALADYAGETGLGFQLHLAESQGEAEECEARTGLTPGELLNCHRVFSVPACAAGCGYLSQAEREMLGKKKVSAIATPIADAKAGRNSAPILESVKAGMNVALGTGGGVDCGNLDMFEAMRFAAVDTRKKEGRPDALPAPAALMMATTCGARAQRRQDSAGMLKENMDADIVLVDFSAPHLMPCHNVLSGLVFSTKGGDVAMTMVQGKVLYQNGVFPTIDLKAVVEDITQYAFDRMFGKEES